MRTFKFETTRNFVNTIQLAYPNCLHTNTWLRTAIIVTWFRVSKWSVIKILTSYATFFNGYNLQSTKRACDLREAICLYVWLRKSKMIWDKILTFYNNMWQLWFLYEISLLFMSLQSIHEDCFTFWYITDQFN